MFFKKAKQTPISYKKASLNLPFVPSAVFCLTIVAIGLYFLLSEYKEFAQKFPSISPWVYGSAFGCILIIILSVLINSVYFFHATSYYKGRGRSCFSYNGRFYEIRNDDSFWGLRFGDLRSRKYYSFPSYCFYPEVHLSISRKGQRIKIVVNSISVYFSFIASQIATFSNGFSEVEKIIKEKIEGAISEAFQEVYQPIEGLVKLPEEDKEMFDKFETSFKSFVEQKPVTKISYFLSFMKISKEEIIPEPIMEDEE